MLKRVLVAMSGGVDSSLAAALLKKQGYDVTGVFIFFESPKETHNNPKSCCSLESFQAAKKVARVLNIPIYSLNMTIDFKQEIIDEFVQEYRLGKTPNPCIKCNKLFKFGRLLDVARKSSYDYLATGHYARTKELKNKRTKEQSMFKLITAKDKNKDQSYFLYTLTQQKLKHILFPLGNYTKPRVRKLAQKYKLPTYQQKDSSDVCFVNTADLRGFLKTRINADTGDVVDMSGKKIGQHQGLAFYTLGQRQGIKIGGTGPYYVVAKDLVKNNLIVTNDKNDPALFSDETFIKDAHWVSGKEPKLPLKCLAQHRYQTQRVSVVVNRQGDKYKVKLDQPVRAVTAGQSMVFYKPIGILTHFSGGIIKKDFEVLGGGIINKISK